MRLLWSRLLIGLGVSGAGLLIFNCAFNPMLNAIMHLKMNQMLALSANSYSNDYWENPPVPVYFEIYVFDIVNADDVLRGAAPAVVERGPYTYSVTLKKLNVTFNDNHTVTYRQRQTFVFDRERSVGWDNDTFTTISAPLFTVGSLLQYQYPFMREAVNLLMDALDETPFLKVSVHDIFWGYDDPFMHLAKEVFDKLHIKSDLITGVFGYYMGKNATDDGQYTVHTGTDDLSKFLVIDTWNGLKLLPYWTSDVANMINGTDGSLYPPFVTTDRVLQMFDSNLFRSLSMKYTEDSCVKDIPTMKFIVEDSEFANATVNPWNKGFCTPQTHCIPSGVLNCSAMGHGAPLYVSMPHFLGADPYYLELVKGLKPNREAHQPYFHLHQLTGVCLSAGRRYQLNVQMKEYHFLGKTKGLKMAYVPSLWINGLAEIDDKIAGVFHDQIEVPLTIINYVHYIFYGIGALMVLVPVIIFARQRWKKRRESEQEDKERIVN